VTRRRFATALLTGYAALLVIAAIPEEVRPRALDGSFAMGRRVLRAGAIQPGVAVFQTRRDDPPIVVRDCIRLRGRDAGGAVHTLEPPDGECFVAGARWTQPWLEGGLRSLILRSPPGLAEPVIGDWVCHGPHWRARELREVELVWTQPWQDLQSGERSRSAS